MKDLQQDMPSWDDQDLERSVSRVSVDLYGIKVSANPRPAPDDMPDPGSWADVAHRVNNDLKGIAGGLVRLIRVAVSSATNFVAGIGGLPFGIVSRITNAHNHSDRAESRRMETATSTQDPEGVDQALLKIISLLRNKQIEGLSAGITFDEESGLVAIHVLPPGTEDAVDRILLESAKTISKHGGLVTQKSKREPITVTSREYETFLSIVQRQDCFLYQILVDTVSFFFNENILTLRLRQQDAALILNDRQSIADPQIHPNPESDFADSELDDIDIHPLSQKEANMEIISCAIKEAFGERAELAIEIVDDSL